MMATIRIPKSKRSEYVTMTSPPSDVVEEERSFGLLPKEGPPAYRILEAPAHIHAPGILYHVL